VSTHPASYKLDGHAAGDRDAEVARHLAKCEPCRRYVERAAALAEADDSPFPLPDGVERAAIAAPTRARGGLARIGLGLAPIAAAAAIALLLHRPSPNSPGETASTASPVAQFKGGVQLAVVRERGGRQERLATDVTVRAFDRLRVEVAVDRERPMTVGLLASDGAWLTLLAPTLLEPGTHLSERAAAVDEHPTEGLVLAGDPEAVEKARSTKELSDVAVLPIHAEP
jgi:hypothetical protein